MFGAHSNVESPLMPEDSEPQQITSSAAGSLAGSITACKKVTLAHHRFFLPLEPHLTLAFQACFLGRNNGDDRMAHVVLPQVCFDDPFLNAIHINGITEQCPKS